MSEILKQKAKTLSDLLWENSLEWDKWLRIGTEKKAAQLSPKFQEKWVRLEDAKKVIEEYGKDKHKLHQILDELSIWTPEKIEQHLSAFLNKDLRDSCWRTEQFVRVVDLQKKFEELLEK